MSNLDDCLRNLSELQHPENDPKNACVYLGSPKYAFISAQISGSRVLASNLGDSNDNIQVERCHLLRSLPMAPRLKNCETNRHHTHPLHRPQLNHPLIIITGQVQVT